MVFCCRTIGKNRALLWRLNGKDGSVLILILWVLVLIGFLSGEYLSHNRGKAALSHNAWDRLKLEAGIDSAIDLFASGYTPDKDTEESPGGWSSIFVGDVNLWVKADEESKRTNINTAQDSEIRQQIQNSFGEDEKGVADEISDAVLDWRDTDTLIRINGAETDYYEKKGLPYIPANGSFKTLTEILLVRGVSHRLFWGDPLAEILNEKEEEKEEVSHPLPSLVEGFTIYAKDVKRLSIIAPGKGKSYTLVLVFLKKQQGKWLPFSCCRSMLLVQTPL